MNKTNYLILIILGFAFLQCQKSQPNSRLNCSFELLRSESVTSTTSDGHRIGLEAEVKIKSNVKKLATLEGTVKASDSIDINVEKTLSKREVNYPSDFLAKHNAIINLLCALETKLKDTTLPSDERLVLMQQLSKGIDQYLEVLFGKEANSIKKIIDSGKAQPQSGEESNVKQILNSSSESKLNSDLYFNNNSKADVAILATSGYKKSDAKTSSDLSTYLTSKGLTNNPVFFKSSFLSKFSDRLRDNDISVFKSLEVQKTVNCVCLINQEDFKIEDQVYENNPFKKASASYNITLFYLNGSTSPQTFQFDDMTGAGANENMAQASLKDNFINSFKNLSINFNQCKK